MAGATRRSDIACQRLKYNPLENGQCLGFITRRNSCKNPVPYHSREIAYFILGQGSHLFSDDSELVSILLEAANHLFCCPEHRTSGDIVEKWVVTWKQREGADREIHNIIQERVHEKGISDKQWQKNFLNKLGQIVRSDLPHKEKLKNVKHAVRIDRCEEMASQSPVSSPESVQPSAPSPESVQPPISRPEPVQPLGTIFRPALSINLPRPEALYLATGRSRGSEPASPASPLPTSLEGFDNVVASSTPLDTVAEDEALTISPFMLSSSEFRPIVRPQVTAPEPEARSMWGVHRDFMPIVTEAASRPSLTSRRGRSLSHLGSSWFRAGAQQRTMMRTIGVSSSRPASGLSRTMSAEDYTQNDDAALTSNHSGPANNITTTNATTVQGQVEVAAVDEDVPSASSSMTVAESSTRPRIKKSSSEPTGESVLRRLRSAFFSRTPAEPTTCDICLLTYDAAKTDAAWECPTCHNKVHHPCFNDWHWECVGQWRETPCPYCRAPVTWR